MKKQKVGGSFHNVQNFKKKTQNIFTFYKFTTLPLSGEVPRWTIYVDFLTYSEPDLNITIPEGSKNWRYEKCGLILIISSTNRGLIEYYDFQHINQNEYSLM